MKQTAKWDWRCKRFIGGNTWEGSRKGSWQEESAGGALGNTGPTRERSPRESDWVGGETLRLPRGSEKISAWPLGGGTRPSKEVPARGGRGSGPVPPREDRPRMPGAGRGPASQRPCSQPSAPCGGSSQIRASRSAARPTFLWSLVPLFLSRRTGSRPPSSRGQRGMKHARN